MMVEKPILPIRASAPREISIHSVQPAGSGRSVSPPGSGGAQGSTQPTGSGGSGTTSGGSGGKK